MHGDGAGSREREDGYGGRFGAHQARFRTTDSSSVVRIDGVHCGSHQARLRICSPPPADVAPTEPRSRDLPHHARLRTSFPSPSSRRSRSSHQARLRIPSSSPAAGDELSGSPGSVAHGPSLSCSVRLGRRLTRRGYACPALPLTLHVFQRSTRREVTRVTKFCFAWPTPPGGDGDTGPRPHQARLRISDLLPLFPALPRTGTLLPSPGAVTHEWVPSPRSGGGRRPHQALLRMRCAPLLAAHDVVVAGPTRTPVHPARSRTTASSDPKKRSVTDGRPSPGTVAHNEAPFPGSTGRSRDGTMALRTQSCRGGRQASGRP
ncbi:MAG: hypothetical protein QOJ30_5348 [Pseudonocardiales bacterium]|nr:hypothetical protein [Pseudonocardiales bacterium]